MINRTSQNHIGRFKVTLALSIILILLTACSGNAQLQPLHNNATILAFGDSLTYGTGASSDKAYPAVLERLTKRKVINAGIPGEISANGLRRLPNLLASHRPDLIIICHGGNDILRKLDLSKTQNNIQQMVDLARENNTQVVLIGVPAFSLFLSKIAIYQTLAQHNNVPIDNNSLANILKSNSLKSDYIHPNGNGYQQLAENINLLLKRHGAIVEN